MVGSMRSMIGFTPLSIFSIFANQSSLEVFGMCFFWNSYLAAFFLHRCFDPLTAFLELAYLAWWNLQGDSNSTWEVPQKQCNWVLSIHFKGLIHPIHSTWEWLIVTSTMSSPKNWVPGSNTLTKIPMFIGSKFKPFNPRSSGVYPDHLGDHGGSFQDAS